MPALDVKPTRTELLAVKRKIVISESGHELLKIKMEGLVFEFFKILREAKSLRKDLRAQHEEASQNIIIASTVEGALAVKTASYALSARPKVTVSSSNIMGVTVPVTKGEAVRRKLEERGYGIIGTSPYISDAARSYEKLVETIITAAGIETTLKKLLEEIDKTKRRVNALEFRIIPQLKEAEHFIEQRLEEMERENTFRLKKIKSKREA